MIFDIFYSGLIIKNGIKLVKTGGTMKEALYNWIRYLAVFYILLTMILHLVPTEKYQRYVRLFMGLLLIAMLLTPILNFLGKGQEFATSFQKIYEKEEQNKMKLEMKALQEKWLEKGCEQEIRQNICRFLQNKGIEIKECKIQIEGGSVKAVIWICQAPDSEIKRGIKDALEEKWGISGEDCEVLSWEDGNPAVGNPSPSGSPYDRDCTSGIG